ncbi:MAG: hypothetical protein ACH350_03890 [Parachlamydiaceae bacterium]
MSYLNRNQPKGHDMPRRSTRNFYLLAFFLLLSFHSYAITSCNGCRALKDWDADQSTILQPTKEKPSRTAVLIIAPPNLVGNGNVLRWKLGKKVWEQYMNAVPDVDCYFIQYTKRTDASRQEEVRLEGNTIYIADEWFDHYGSDRILHKTIAAIEFLLPDYTHFIRTNLNTFLNLHYVRQYTRTHHQSMYTGPLWQGEWYVIGYGILFTEDVAMHMVSEYRRLEGMEIVSHHRADDCILTSLATGIYPFEPSEHWFCCSPTLPLGSRQLMCQQSFSTHRLSQYGALLLPPISLDEAKKYCESARHSVMLYRIREGLTLVELAELYDFLCRSIYQDLSIIDLKEYALSLTNN